MTHIYSQKTKSFNKINIKTEYLKRKNIYNILNLTLSLNTYLDFFSNKFFEILLYSQILSSKLNNLKISLSTIFFFLILLNKNINKVILKSINSKFLISEVTKTLFLNNLKKKNRYISFLDFQFKKDVLKEFSYLIKYNIKNFKTFIITPELFFLTLLDSKKLSRPYILQKIQTNYKIKKIYNIATKNIYIEEKNIKKDLKFIYFKYLLKRNLSYFELTKLSNFDILFFRNIMLKYYLNLDIFKIITQDYLKSINSLLLKKRKYII
jgi:hypothetical protein